MRRASDVQAELENRLANLQDFRVWCTLVEGKRLAEYALETEEQKGDLDPEVAVHIREGSRAMASPRTEIEKSIGERMARGVPPSSF